MNEKKVTDWISQPKISRILRSFSVPQTPRQVEKELGIQKLKLKPFLSKDLLKSLNPQGRKGRFYLLTDRAREMLKLPGPENEDRKDWDLIGWVRASPLQRLVVLQTMSIDSAKRTSEDIRKRASRLNTCLSRLSTKAILKELVNRGLVETKMGDRKRYYWISDKGTMLLRDIY